jgi:hypothetical protein
VDGQLLHPSDPFTLYEPESGIVTVPDHVPLLLFAKLTLVPPTEAEGLPQYSPDPADTVTVTGVPGQTGFVDKVSVCANADGVAQIPIANTVRNAANALRNEAGPKSGSWWPRPEDHNATRDIFLSFPS